MNFDEHNIDDYNSHAWDKEVERGCKWTVPVSPDVIARAREGEVSIVLTPQQPVPCDWFPALGGSNVLCLASGGGQQAPILAAAGANVTLLDNSTKQLDQDRMVAEREGLTIRLIKGDMRDLSMLDNGTFELVFHPCSNNFVSDVRPIWNECFRVLKRGGVLLAGFTNPSSYLFDELVLERENRLEVRHKLPFAEVTDLDEASRQYFTEREEPLLFGHLLTDQIGGQLDAGFHLTGFFEDRPPNGLLAEYMPTCIATRALKP